MTKEIKSFDKQGWVDELARLIASGRNPPSTVYMDGSHNPRPTEIQKATMFVNDFLEFTTKHRDQLKMNIQDAIDNIRKFKPTARTSRSINESYDDGRADAYIIVLAWIEDLEKE